MTLFEVIKLGFFYGCFISLVALGFGLIYNILHVVDFAHTDRLVVCGYVYLTALDHTSHLVALLLAIIAGVVFAILSEMLIYRKIRKVNPSLLLLTTFGLSIIIQNSLALIFSDNLLEYPFTESQFFNTSLYLRELIIFPVLLFT